MSDEQAEEQSDKSLAEVVKESFKNAVIDMANKVY